MAFRIQHYNKVALDKRKYLFDANIWLILLRPPFNPTKREEGYLGFFDRFRNHPESPKIVLPALILAEVINRYLREVSFAKFCRKNGVSNPDKSYYKETYRPSAQFQLDYISLCEDIKAYHSIYELIPDSLGNAIKSKHILTSPPVGLDFNDHYYYLLARNNNYIIVTDDGDFLVDDVEILTGNARLIEKASKAG